MSQLKIHDGYCFPFTSLAKGIPTWRVFSEEESNQDSNVKKGKDSGVKKN